MSGAAPERVRVVLRADYAGRVRVAELNAADLPTWRKGMDPAVSVRVFARWLDRPYNSGEWIDVSPWAAWDRPGAVRYLTGRCPHDLELDDLALIAGRLTRVYGTDLGGRVWHAGPVGPAWAPARDVREPLSLPIGG